MKLKFDFCSIMFRNLKNKFNHQLNNNNIENAPPRASGFGGANLSFFINCIF